LIIYQILGNNALVLGW